MYSIEDASAPSKKVYKFCRPSDLSAHKAHGPAIDIAMEDDISTDIWIYYCARQLKMHWRTVDPEQLEELASDLSRELYLRQLSPQAAAAKWLEPVLVSRDSSAHPESLPASARSRTTATGPMPL